LGSREITNSRSAFSYTPGLGYMINYKTDFNFHFNVINTDNNTVFYVGLRSSYKF